MSDLPESDIHQLRRRRRERPMLVCLECHRRKLKCDKKKPCDRCSKSCPPLKCTYTRPAAVSKIRHILQDVQPLPSVSRAEDPNPHPTGDPDRPSGVVYQSSPHLSPNVCQRSLGSEPCDRDLSQSPATAPSTLYERPHNGDIERPAGTGAVAQAEATPADITSKRTWRGRSGVQWLFFKLDHITTLANQAGFSLPTGEFTTFSESKTKLFQRRTLFLEDAQGPQLSILDEFPPRETTDTLIERYFETFGSVFRFLHQSSFQAQTQMFWEAPESVSISICIQILLVVAIGNGTVDQSNARLPHTKTMGWWHLILAWQGVALRLNPGDINTLQACCLIELMRHTYSLDFSACWPSSGMLVRNAMMAGLHRDPYFLDQIFSKEQLDIRQNLWYTILELDLQSSMDQGMQPAVTCNDWDMPLPDDHNANDKVEGAASKAASPRGILVSTLTVRMRIAQFLNNIKCSTSYEEASRLHEELEALAHPLLSSPPVQKDQPGHLGFSRGFPKCLCQRSLLALHLPFAILRRPSYAYSYNICMSTALSLLERIDPPAGQNDHNDYNGVVVLMRTSGNIFRTIALQAILFLCFQMEASLKNHQPWTLVTELRDRSIGIIERYLVIAEERLKTQDFVGKAFIVPAIALAHAKLSNSGMSNEDVAACGRIIAEEVTARCFSIFRNRPDIPPT